MRERNGEQYTDADDNERVPRRFSRDSLDSYLVHPQSSRSCSWLAISCAPLPSTTTCPSRACMRLYPLEGLSAPHENQKNYHKGQRKTSVIGKRRKNNPWLNIFRIVVVLPRASPENKIAEFCTLFADKKNHAIISTFYYSVSQNDENVVFFHLDFFHFSRSWSLILAEKDKVLSNRIRLAHWLLSN